MTSSKFQSGDMVIGNQLNKYSITGKGSICEVMELVEDTRMFVKLITPSPRCDEPPGGTYLITQFGFDLIEPNSNRQAITRLRGY